MGKYRGGTPQPGRAPRMPRPKVNHKAEHNDNGMIKALHDHADQQHPVGIVAGPNGSASPAPVVSGGDTADDY